MGYGIPYDTSLTSPTVATAEDSVNGWNKQALTSIDQPEPNGVFASKNTSATWVLCLGDAGLVDPVYVESEVNVYPFPLSINYQTGRVTKTGKSTVTLKR